MTISATVLMGLIRLFCQQSVSQCKPVQGFWRRCRSVEVGWATAVAYGVGAHSLLTQAEVAGILANSGFPEP